MLEKNDNGIFIRTLKSEDMDAAEKLWLQCFNDDTKEFVDYYFKRRTSPERMLGLFVFDAGGASLTSMLCVEKTELMLESGNGVKAAFIAGVCTAPKSRNRGYIRKLMKHAERMAANDGAKALLLQPFDFSYYEKLGFTAYASQKLIEPRLAGEAQAKPLKSPDAKFMHAVYSAMFEKTPGMLKRSALDCEKLIEEYSLDGYNTLCIGDEKNGAYALWSDERKKPCLDEFAYSDIKSAKELIKALNGMLGSWFMPISPDEERIDGDFTVKPFNMIMPTEGNKLEELLPNGCTPFDFKKY